jgi:hypothetical protein
MGNGNLTLMQYSNTCIVPDGKGKPCGYRFDNLPLKVPVIGEPPEERAQKIVEAMGKHLLVFHPSLMMGIKAESERVFGAFRVASQFNITDPNAIFRLKILRVALLSAIGKPFIPDEDIRATIQNAGPLTPESVFVLLATMRDKLCEIAPPSPPPLIETPSGPVV